MENIPFAEKYRPKAFDQVIGVPETERIEKLSSDLASMPNLLFQGSAGIGKTTIAKIILAHHQPVNILKTHGADVNIDYVRNVIVPFCQSQSSEQGKRKIIFIDEFDGVTSKAYDDLRTTMEDHFKNAVYVATCNKPDKIIDPIRSRFEEFKFKKPVKEDVVGRLFNIADKEGIKYDTGVLEAIYIRARGDFRRSINMLQSLGTSDLITVEMVNRIKDEIIKVLECIRDRDWTKIRMELSFQIDDFEDALAEIDAKIFNHAAYDEAQKQQVNKIVANALFEMKGMFRKDIHFSATCLDLIKVLGK